MDLLAHPLNYTFGITTVLMCAQTRTICGNLKRVHQDGLASDGRMGRLLEEMSSSR